MWLSNPSCEEVVYSTSDSRSGVGIEGDILCKVEKCGKELGKWEKNVFGDAGNNIRVRQIKKEIEVMQEREATMWAQR